MLASSKEYIQALRDGNYLLFLEWPQFIKEKYKDADLLNSDTLPNLLCFEWLNNGYCEDDAKKLALLARVNDSESRPLQGLLSFTVLMMMTTALQCMLYHTKNIHSTYMTKAPMNKEQVLNLMNAPIVGLDKAEFSKLIGQQNVIFQKWIADCGSATVIAVSKRIKAMTDLRNLVQDYKNKLKSLEVEDQLKASRLSVIDRLLTYLSEQFVATSTVTEEVVKFVNQLRTMQPATIEEEFLNRLAPLSVTDNAWKFGANIVCSIFAYLQPVQPVVVQKQVIIVPSPSESAAVASVVLAK